MKPIHLLACLCGVLTVLLDLAVLTAFRTGYDTPLMLFVGLAVGQLALLAFWCVLARGFWAARLIVTLAAAGLLSQPLGKVTGGSWSQWFTLLCLFAACTGGVMLLARWLGVRPMIVAVAPDAVPTPRKRRFQFSLGGLLSVMTVVGIALGVSRYLAFPTGSALAVASYGFWLVLIASATLWALVPRQALLARLLGLAALCLTAGWFMARTEHQQSAWFFTNIALVEAIIICAGIAVIQSGARAATAAETARET